MIEQRGLLNHLLYQASYLELSASDVVAHTAPQSFVISVWQFLAGLMVGARIHICADEVVRDPALLVQELEREGVTVLQIVPTLLRTIVDAAATENARRLTRLRWLISTGEAISPDLCRRWFRHFPDVPLINAYGSAECSDDVATHRMTAPPTSIATVPIGRPIANTRLYVLDAHLQPVPIGVPGELYVGGIGVGRGYLNDQEQTRRAFLRNPFSKNRKARVYRTRDLARWRADGTLEYLGRLDHQIKIRGYRIELKEIEHVLMDHPDVQTAIVLTRDGLEGEARLVAYIVSAPGRQQQVNELRNFLKSRLPAYMIPVGFIFLERIPLTAHGKANRLALAANSLEPKVASSDFVAPRDSTERVLANIWAELLELDKVGVFDNFFDLGGQSRLAGQVLVRVANAFGVSLQLRALFEAPTIETLARRIDEARGTRSNEPAFEITPIEIDCPQPVSIAQEYVLRSERVLPGLPQFNLPFVFRLKGPLNVSAVERSLSEVVRRHDTLRTRFAFLDGRPVATIAPAADIYPFLTIEDLTAQTDPARAMMLKKAELEAELEAWTPFDITRAPLFRARLLRLGADDHVLLLTLHHVIVDGWSIGVFLEEISELYLAFTSKRQAKLPKPPLQFSDFARWQRLWSTTDTATQQFAYWKEHLRDVLPVFPADGNGGGALLASRIGHESVHLSNDLVARLSALSRREGSTLFMTLLAALKTVLLARSGRNDICVATAMANRCQQKTERLIGPLENTILIRTQLYPDLSFQDALCRVRELVLEAYARQELPFEFLVARLAKEDGLDPTSLIQVFFVLQHAPRRPFQLPHIAIGSFGNAYQAGQVVRPIDRTWLTLMLKETPFGVIGSCTYKKDQFGPNGLQHWVDDYKSILTKVVANPATALGRLARA